MTRPRRLILVPQLPVKLRYSEWWIDEFYTHLAPHFSEVIVLGQRKAKNLDFHFTSAKAVENEARQLEEYIRLTLTPHDVLLHLDLSYPGLFHSVLAHRRPARCVAFCHATALNTLDIFEPVRDHRWPMEYGAAGFYDKVLVATEYHASKIRHRIPHVKVMHGLPRPPARLLPAWYGNGGGHRFISVARPQPQKMDPETENEIHRLSGHPVVRPVKPFDTWAEYFEFLDRGQYLVLTPREETYGYAVQDALLRGCVPIAPNGYSFPELLPPSLLYDPRGTPAERAVRIHEIANRNPPCPRALVCQGGVDNFYNNLAQELLA